MDSNYNFNKKNNISQDDYKSLMDEFREQNPEQWFIQFCDDDFEDTFDEPEHLELDVRHKNGRLYLVNYTYGKQSGTAKFYIEGNKRDGFYTKSPCPLPEIDEFYNDVVILKIRFFNYYCLNIEKYNSCGKNRKSFCGKSRSV